IVGGLASPVLLTIVRFVSGFGMLLLLRATFPRSFSGPFRGRPDLIGGFLLGLYAFSISFGYEFISAAAGTLVFYAFVILTMALFGVVHDRETPTLRSIVGQILALAGVAVIAFGGIREVSLPGVALMAVTGSSWGLYSAHGRSGGDPRAYTFNTFLVLAGFCLVLIPVAEIVATGALSIQISGNGLGLALFMGMISTSLSYVLWHLTLRRIKASHIARPDPIRIIPGREVHVAALLGVRRQGRIVVADPLGVRLVLRRVGPHARDHGGEFGIPMAECRRVRRHIMDSPVDRVDVH